MKGGRLVVLKTVATTLSLYTGKARQRFLCSNPEAAALAPLGGLWFLPEDEVPKVVEVLCC